MQYGFILLIVLCLLFSPCISSYACVGARPMGMGGAFTAVADDINAVYWNPAGLQQLKTRELTYKFGPDRFDDGDFKSAYPHFAAFAVKPNKNLTIALDFYDILNVTEDGNNYQIGAEQMVTQSVVIRTGCYGNDNFTFGSGYLTDHFNLDFNVWFNPPFKEYNHSSLGFIIKF